MTLTTTHSVDKGVFRLINAPRDLPENSSFHNPKITLSQSSEPHRKAFSDYLTDMAEIYEFAAKWWEAGLDGIMREEGVSREKAVKIAIFNRMAGPAAVPDVVWLVRTYWLKCAEINKTVPEEQRVPPEVFLLRWLVDRNETEWVKLLSCMPYWPIGLDENGEWC